LAPLGVPGLHGAEPLADDDAEGGAAHHVEG